MQKLRNGRKPIETAQPKNLETASAIETPQAQNGEALNEVKRRQP